MRWGLLFLVSILISCKNQSVGVVRIVDPTKSDRIEGNPNDPKNPADPNDPSHPPTPQPTPPIDPTPIPTPQPTPDPQQSDIPSQLFICSKLDFTGMKAPLDFSNSELNAFALSLNITSTFEGRESWKTISNNFDGMGLSLGLLNQTLGTGSLQPLILDLLENNESLMRTQYSDANFRSLQGMLLTWKKDKGIKSVNDLQQIFANTNISKNSDLFNDEKVPLSALDEGSGFFILGSAETKSVDWALKTIYTSKDGKTFKPDWKIQIQQMAGTAEYRTLQFDAARTIHDKAAKYFDYFQFSQIRSYLFLFDIVVQNGGFYQKNLDEFKSFMKSNPKATEKEKLYALLNSRLKQVRSEYRNDVKARKSSLIEGQGKVHGSQRQYEKEYCYQSEATL